MSKIWSKFLYLMVAGVVILGVFGLIGLMATFINPKPNLRAYLSQHELIIPSDSQVLPQILKKKLSEESMLAWMEAEGVKNGKMDETLKEVQRYLTVNVLLDLPDDAIANYTNYYLLKIENDSNRLFEDVQVSFPSIKAVEIRRSGISPTMATLENGRYIIGEIEPGETVDVYAWNNRPFYVQEEKGVVLRHGGQPVEIYQMGLVSVEHSWVKDNLLLVALLGGLVLFFIQKMFFIIRTCTQNVDPKIGKTLSE